MEEHEVPRVPVPRHDLLGGLAVRGAAVDAEDESRARAHRVHSVDAQGRAEVEHDLALERANLALGVVGVRAEDRGAKDRYDPGVLGGEQIDKAVQWLVICH